MKKAVLLTLIFLSYLNVFSQNTYTIDQFNISFEATQELIRSVSASGTSASFDNDDISIDIERVSYDRESEEFVNSAKYGAIEIAKDYGLQDIVDGGVLSKIDKGYYVKGFDLEDGKRYPVFVLVILDDAKKMAYEISVDCYGVSESEAVKIIQSFEQTY